MKKFFVLALCMMFAVSICAPAFGADAAPAKACDKDAKAKDGKAKTCDKSKEGKKGAAAKKEEKKNEKK